MCIIAYAPKGVQIKEQTIEVMFDYNPDGAGIMWKPLNGDKVQIRKGFMTLSELMKAYEQIPVECEKAIHCRIATSGKISPATCHPFPVRNKIKAMKKAVDETDMALMHNGVISFCTPKEGLKAKHSDTMEFAQQYLMPLRNQLDNPALKKLLGQTTNSRLLIFRRNKPTVMIGDWEQEEGVYYSNDTYKDDYGYGPYKSYYKYGYWDEDGYANPHSYKQCPTSTWLSIQLTNVNTPEDLSNAEDEIINALYDLNYDVAGIYSEEYANAFYVEVEVVGKGADSLEMVAGYQVTHIY